MTTAVQHRRGTTAEHSTFTGLEGEVTIDTTKDTAVIHDGAQAGGYPLAKETLSNVNPSSLGAIDGTSTASDDLFLIYDTSVSQLKKISRAELNNAITVDPFDTVDINGGTIDGTVIGGASAAAGTFTSVNSTTAIASTSTTTPLVIGGTSTTSTLRLRSTSGVGTTGADIIFQVGNNGATEAMRVLNSGNVGIGTASPTSKLSVNGTLGVGGTISALTPIVDPYTSSSATQDTPNGVILGIRNTDFSVDNLAALMSFTARNVSASQTDIWYIGNGGRTGAWNSAFVIGSRNGALSYIEKARISGTGNLGLSTTNPSYIVSLGGNSARTMGMERHTTSNTAGNSLTVLAGGATSGATDKAGGALILSSGTSTGTGTSSIAFQTATAGSAGTADNAPTTKLTIAGNGDVSVASGKLTFSTAVSAADVYGIYVTSTIGTTVNTATGTNINFNTGTSERARITSSGNFLVGTTTNTNSSLIVSNGTISETVSSTQYLVASQADIGTAANDIPLNQYLGALAYEDTETPALDVGTGITGGTGTICKANGGLMGGIYRMTVLIDLTGLNSGGTAGDIIGLNGTALPCYIARLPAMTVLGGRMTCLETPAGGDTDIDLYSATEGTGVEDQAITNLTETQIINAGAQTIGTVTYFAADPAANAYFYLVGQGTANATYTAGRFLIEIFGVQ